MMDLLKNTKQHLLTGVSYMIPFTVAGGVLLALAVMVSGKAAVPQTGVLKMMSDIGIAGLTLFIPILGGFIAYSMVDRPGIAPGMIGAYLANLKGGGFLGGIVAGIIAGIVIHYLKQIKVPKVMNTVMPIFILPLVGTLVVGMLVLGIVGEPMGALMNVLSNWLQGMQGTSKVVMGLILGCMITFDMGGPLNKTAFFFAVAMMTENPTLMAAVAVPVCTPPLGLGLATLIAKKKFTIVEQEAGKAALIMGCIGITEGAIPFAAADPLKVLPAIMTGGATASITALFFGATNHAPWGGLIVLPVVENRLGYLIAVLVGVVVTATIIILLKKEVTAEILKEANVNIEIDDDLDITF